MNIYLLDGKDMTSREAAYEVIAKELNLPKYFGRNLDALYDCLTELPKDDAILFIHSAALEENLSDYAGKILSCFTDAAGECGFLLKIRH